MASGESVVVLKSQADWPRWLAVIQTKANHNSVWDYIKPTLGKEEIRPELHKPSPPVVKDYATNPDTVPAPTTRSLTANQLNQYQADYKVYRDELKEWKLKQNTINDIDDYIMRTTGTYWSTIERVQGVKERLQRLKEHVAPSNYAREQEVLARYDSVRKSAKATQTDEWLQQWESVLSDLKERKLPEAEGIRPTRAFLQAVEPIQPLFTQTWINTIESTAVMYPSDDLTTKIPDGFQIAQIFRNQANLITRDATAAFSTATLQGKEAENQGKTDQTCFEGYGRHTLNSCFYLRKDLRPDGWKMDIEKVRLLLRGLKKSPDLQERHQEAIKEMEDFLNRSEKKDTLSPETQSKSIIGEA
jgi:ribosomal protein L10